MSRFFSEKLAGLIPYVPGEQPKDMVYLKLNTNESPFSPSEKAIKAAEKAAEKLQLYPDPECSRLTEKAAEIFGVNKEEVIAGNGSDEILNFAFTAFCDDKRTAVFPDITYGFYPVFANLNGIKYREIPLKSDFTVDLTEYHGNETLFLANPNAPTGIFIGVDEIEKVVANNPDRMVVIDEAYVDFGGESCVPLIKKYDNLLVVKTFSKSRSMAGARLGFGIGNKELIRDLNTIRYSTNPYNVNSMTMAAGIGVMEDEEYTRKNCLEIVKNRDFTVEELKKLGFSVLQSKANFVFAKSEEISGKELYLKLKEKGVLIRHFDKTRLKEYNRITIGSKEQMEKFISTVKLILEEK